MGEKQDYVGVYGFEEGKPVANNHGIPKYHAMSLAKAAKLPGKVTRLGFGCESCNRFFGDQEHFMYHLKRDKNNVCTI